MAPLSKSVPVPATWTERIFDAPFSPAAAVPPHSKMQPMDRVPIREGKEMRIRPPYAEAAEFWPEYKLFDGGYLTKMGTNEMAIHVPLWPILLGPTIRLRDGQP